MDQDEMVSYLKHSRKWTEKKRQFFRQENSPEAQKEQLHDVLMGLGYAYHDLQPEVIENCDGYGAWTPEYLIAKDAYLIELYSDNPEQIEKARLIRLACRRAIAQQKQCIFVREALPLIRELIEGIELPPLPRGPNQPPKPNP